MQKISLSSRKIRGSEDYYFSRVLMTGSQRDNIQDKKSLITNQLNSNYQLTDLDYRLEETKKNEFIIIPKTIKCRQNVDDLYITLSVNN